MHRGHDIRIAHLGIAVETLQQGLAFYRDVLGLPDVPVPLADADGAKIVGLTAGESLVELLEPATDDSPIAKYIHKRGPGLHHICFSVPDIEAMLDKCRAAGVRLIDQTPRIGAEGRRIAFIHPASTGGVLVELTEG